MLFKSYSSLFAFTFLIEGSAGPTDTFGLLDFCRAVKLTGNFTGNCHASSSWQRLPAVPLVVSLAVPLMVQAVVVFAVPSVAPSAVLSDNSSMASSVAHALALATSCTVLPAVAAPASLV